MQMILSQLLAKFVLMELYQVQKLAIQEVVQLLAALLVVLSQALLVTVLVEQAHLLM